MNRLRKLAYACVALAMLPVLLVMFAMWCVVVIGPFSGVTWQQWILGAVTGIAAYHGLLFLNEAMKKISGYPHKRNNCHD